MRPDEAAGLADLAGCCAPPLRSRKVADIAAVPVRIELMNFARCVHPGPYGLIAALIEHRAGIWETARPAGEPDHRPVGIAGLHGRCGQHRERLRLGVRVSRAEPEPAPLGKLAAGQAAA